MKNNLKPQYVLSELVHHIPYSIFGVTLGLILMGVLTFLAILMGAEDKLPEASSELFHIFHPAHLLFSAVATTAMFWKHEKRLGKAIVVGFIGSVAICGLSDIIFPYIGGLILGSPMRFHICIIEEPALVLPFVIFGVLAGLLVPAEIEKSTQYSHSAHVFLSSAASVLYLLSFGIADWVHGLGGVFLVTVFAVMVPCCTSDIVFPLACVHRGCKHD